MPFWRKSEDAESPDFHTRGTTELERGMVEYAQGNFARAVRWSSQELEVRPGRTEALYLRAAAFVHLGHPELARDDLAAIVRSGAEPWQVRDAACRLGRACENKSDARAAEAYGQAIEIDPRHSLALRSRGRVLLRLAALEESREGRTALLERAVADLDAAIAVDDSDASVHWQRATVAIELERPDEAIPALETFIRLAEPRDRRVKTAQRFLGDSRRSGSEAE